MKITAVVVAAMFAVGVAGSAVAGSCCASKAAEAAPVAKAEKKGECCNKTCSKDAGTTTVASAVVKK